MNSSEERRRFLTDCMQALSHVPGVTGIGFGMRFTNGELLQEKCIQVYVPRKMMRSELSNRAVVPPAIDGFPTDVIVQESRVKGNGPVCPPTRTSTARVVGNLTDTEVILLPDAEIYYRAILPSWYRTISPPPASINPNTGLTFQGNLFPTHAGKPHIMSGVPIQLESDSGTIGFVARTGSGKIVVISCSHVYLEDPFVLRTDERNSTHVSIGIPRGHRQSPSCDRCLGDEIIAHLKDKTNPVVLGNFGDYDDSASAYLLPGKSFYSPQVYLPEGRHPRPNQPPRRPEMIPIQGTYSLTWDTTVPPPGPGSVIGRVIANGPVYVFKSGGTTGYTEGFIFGVYYALPPVPGTARPANSGLPLGLPTGQTHRVYEFIRICPARTPAEGVAVTRVDTANNRKAHAFGLPGDSGSLVLTRDDNRAVGLLQAVSSLQTRSDEWVIVGDLVPIDRIQCDLGVEILTAPGPAGTRIEPIPAPTVASVSVRSARRPADFQPTPSASSPEDEGGTFSNGQTVSKISHQISSMRTKLLASEAGSFLLLFLQNHAEEIWDLISSHKVVAISWHRAHGPKVVRALGVWVVDGVEDGQVVFPTHASGLPFEHRLESFSEVLQQYGGTELRSKLARVTRLMKSLSGCTSTTCLDQLARMSG